MDVTLFFCLYFYNHSTHSGRLESLKWQLWGNQANHMTDRTDQLNATIIFLWDFQNKSLDQNPTSSKQLHSIPVFKCGTLFPHVSLCLDRWLLLWGSGDLHEQVKAVGEEQLVGNTCTWTHSNIMTLLSAAHFCRSEYLFNSQFRQSTLVLLKW